MYKTFVQVIDFDAITCMGLFSFKYNFQWSNSRKRWRQRKRKSCSELSTIRRIQHHCTYPPSTWRLRVTSGWTNCRSPSTTPRKYYELVLKLSKLIWGNDPALMLWGKFNYYVIQISLKVKLGVFNEMKFCSFISHWYLFGSYSPTLFTI